MTSPKTTQNSLTLRPALLVACLLLSLYLTGCGKGGGIGSTSPVNAEGFEGGDAMYEALSRSQANLQRAMDQLETGYDVESLCAVSNCDVAKDPRLCETLRGLDAAKVAGAKEFILGNRPQLETLLAKASREIFTFSRIPLLVDGSPVPGMTDPDGADLDVLLYYPDLLTMSPGSMEQLVFHELGHNIVDAIAGKKIRDKDEVSRFPGPTGGKDLLNAAGACVAVYAAKMVAYRDRVLASNPAGYWRLNEAQGATKAADSSGHGVEGIYTGPVLHGVNSALAHDSDRSARFSGTPGEESTVKILLPQNVASAASVTVELWMYWQGASAFARIVGFNLYDLMVTGNQIAFNTANGDLFGVGGVSLENRWVHVVAVFDNGDATKSKLYLDGSPQSLAVLSVDRAPVPRSLSREFNISGWPTHPSATFTGAIDEVSLYPFELSAAEVAEHFRAGAR